jgi:hypothetical protein
MLSTYTAPTYTATTTLLTNHHKLSLVVVRATPSMFMMALGMAAGLGVAIRAVCPCMPQLRHAIFHKAMTPVAVETAAVAVRGFCIAAL